MLNIFRFVLVALKTNRHSLDGVVNPDSRTVTVKKQKWNICPALRPFLPLHATSNGAVMPSHDVCPSVCLSVTLMDADHIR